MTRGDRGDAPDIRSSGGLVASLQSLMDRSHREPYLAPCWL